MSSEWKSNQDLNAFVKRGPHKLFTLNFHNGLKEISLLTLLLQYSEAKNILAIFKQTRPQ